MGSSDNSWADADGLLVGLLDSECKQARERYLKSVMGKQK
jgi:hypothetical protein